MDLTPEQQAAVAAFGRLYSGNGGGRRLVMGGLAGTGKSTVIRACVEAFPDVVVCTPTGKAAHVLRSKGVEEATTIHALIYKPIVSRSGGLSFEPRYLRDRYDVAIVDEASMVHLEMMDALLQALPPTARLVLLGDKDQLASVEAGGKVVLVAGVTAGEVGRIKAGEVVGNVAAQIGGRGGGRPDFAQAGGTDAGKLPEALASVVGLVRQKLAG
jgi:hypothetical protein